MAEPQRQMATALSEERKRLLIDATIGAIAEHGLSGLTLAKAAARAGMTAGSVNFHFTSKEALLMAVLRHLAEEFDATVNGAAESAGGDPAERLRALVAVHLDPGLSDPRKIAVWYAFMSEAGARKDYQQICADRDTAYYRSVLDLCRQIADHGAGAQAHLDSEAVAFGLIGLMDQLWQEILFAGDGFDRAAGQRRCLAYLASVFPWAFEMPGRPPREHSAAPAPGDDPGLVHTLPAWIYNHPEFLELEREHVFMPAWQLACHVSDLPRTGSWVTFDLLDERAVIVRDRAGVIRAFHNVCRHRAHTLVQDASGQCPGRLTCPYHGWTYALDGTRIGIGAPETFRPHAREQFGLLELDCEILFGFVFIRFRRGGPGVAEQFAPVMEEFSRYRTEAMVPADPERGPGAFWDEVVEVDWKNGLENYVEDYHFPTGHKGLSALMEDDYSREPFPGGLARLSHAMRETPLPNWSVGHYHRLLPRIEHLPEDMQRRWNYYAFYPNTFFDLFPDKMDFMQMIPVAPGKMRLRGRCYSLPDDRREMKAVRYLNDRINKRVQNEDNFLTSEVQKGLRTSAYRRGILSDKEILVKHFQDWLREQLPVAQLAEAPARGTVAERNRAMPVR